ncbi:hypothetical protein HJD18_04940 [Thermoleophilia bacterium SCSIO 60948]|nr:hypothetical protein HJD18_04940 [Thermoleophilia bacterium SCSIO 60948]
MTTAPAGPRRRPTSAERRRRLLRRAVPLGVGGAIAFVAGAIAGGGGEISPSATRYAEAWSNGDTAAMYAELSPAATDAFSRERFEEEIARAADTATLDDIDAAVVSEGSQDGRETATLAVAAQTRIFGTIDGSVELVVGEEGIEWAPDMAFPGLEPGESLERRTTAPKRGPILASDGTPLAEGQPEERSSPLGAPAAAIAGVVGEPKRAEAEELEARGFPAGSLAGTSGLEFAFDERLAGTPGGRLVAVAEGEPVGQGEVLAESEPVDGQSVRTTIEPDLQSSAVAALGSLYGGVTVLDATNGDVLAVAGLGFSAPQPPGSTMKVITAGAALEDGIVSLDDQFPVETSNSDIGYEIANSHESACGGSFVESFAESCNTVFAPLGAELGGKRLVEASEEFGFNEPPTLYDPELIERAEIPSSTIPRDISDSVEVGVSAIGQGEVLATPLEMASVAQTIANDGVRSPTSLVRGAELKAPAEDVEVISPEVAEQVTELMKAVVAGGTGTAAAVPGVTVAGKTGTAELGPATGSKIGEEETQELDAWFTAFAPADEPKYAIAVMVVNAEGDGGVVAAPIAQAVLADALG